MYWSSLLLCALTPVTGCNQLGMQGITNTSLMVRREHHQTLRCHCWKVGQ